MAAKLNLKKRREAKQLTIRELAALAGIGVMTVWRAENDDRWPAHAVVRIALQKALA